MIYLNAAHQWALYGASYKDPDLSAAAFLADRVARPACLILDQNMSQITGLELAAKLRTTGATIPVLLITGSPSPAIVARTRHLGIERVLEKLPDEDDLLSFVAVHQ